MNRDAIRGWMFDLDGTLVLGDRKLGGYQLLPGAIETLQGLDARGIPWVVLTNGSAQPPAQQAAKLRAIGLPVTDERMLTPSSVTAEVLQAQGVQRVLVLGSRGVGHALEAAGIQCVWPGEPDATRVQGVYVGWHPDCDMHDIEAACNAIWGGAKLYVASDVPFFATREGRSMGYSYAIVGAIRRVTRAPMIITGKPSLHALRFVARKLGLKPRQVGVVGDDPVVEVLMARRGGAHAFGVCTGVNSAADWEATTGLRRPHAVLARVDEVLAHPDVSAA